VLSEYRVSADNFVIAKSLAGDPSDNIPGVKGVGFKSAAKYFPFLGSTETIILEDVFKFCNAHRHEQSIYRRVLEVEEDIKRNYRLIYLGDSSLSQNQREKLDHIVENYRPRANMMKLIECVVREGQGEFDVTQFLHTFNCIEGMTHS
jgi:5'-3' exonuclease